MQAKLCRRGDVPFDPATPVETNPAAFRSSVHGIDGTVRQPAVARFDAVRRSRGQTVRPEGARCCVPMPDILRHKVKGRFRIAMEPRHQWTTPIERIQVFFRGVGWFDDGDVLPIAIICAGISSRDEGEG